MIKPEIDKTYTKIWVDQKFNNERVVKYDDKFKNKWEKNIKHVQQVNFIKRYLYDDTYWCDFPIGSGRLEEELSTKKMLGLDISEAFLKYNIAKGRNCEKADLLNQHYQNKFDLVTSLHTVSAFSECDKILEGYIDSLNKGGVLIVDVTNKYDYAYNAPKSYTKKDIKKFIEERNCELLEAQYHDFWDHPRITAWRNTNSRFKNELWWMINRMYFSKKLLISKPTFFALNAIERLFGQKSFTKILIAVKKK